ncbi:MAG: glycosyltransferase family 4 protein [bacterium]
MFEQLIFCFPYDAYHCVSQYTMNAIRLVYGVSDKKITMIHNGVDTNFRNPEEVTPSDSKTWKNHHGRNNRFVITYYGHAGKSK